MNTRLDTRLKGLEARQPGFDEIRLILRVIVKPTPQGPFETGQYLVRVPGQMSGFIANKGGETSTAFLARVCSAYPNLVSAA